jgi:hypothetical protein
MRIKVDVRDYEGNVAQWEVTLKPGQPVEVRRLFYEGIGADQLVLTILQVSSE